MLLISSVQATLDTMQKKAISFSKLWMHESDARLMTCWDSREEGGLE